ncbi:MAG: hypothetical protein IH948_10370 [Bacteroidetes bacterium]|nr:hypothetical protein [Bacteroidota bacterium]
MIKNRLSKKFNWTASEAEGAVNELRNYSEFEDITPLLRLFDSDKKYKQRTNSFKDYIHTSFAKKSTEQFNKYIIQILNVDSSFRALALLNASDFIDSKSNGSMKILYPNDKKSLIYWKLSFQEQRETSLDRNQMLDNDLQYYTDPQKLSYDFANDLLNLATSERSIYPQLQDFISELLENTGFTAFNLSLVQNHFSELSYNAYSNRESLISYVSVLNNTFLDRNTVNNKRYWLIFVLVEELISRGYGTRESFRECERLLGEKRQTVQRRYYEMKKKFVKEHLLVPSIVNRYGLGQALYDLILRLI